jgi:hypothetical protein
LVHHVSTRILLFVSSQHPSQLYTVVQVAP